MNPDDYDKDAATGIKPAAVIARIARAIEILEKQFGIPEWRRKDPLDELMVTLLSQNTNDANRDRAYNQLRNRFPNWESVLKADVADIKREISTAGLGDQKSRRMKDILSWIENRFGELTLEPLREMPDNEVIKLMTQLKGIGVKTVAVTLAFSLDRDLCPVDTHVHRISKRLGWVPENTDAEQTFWTIKEFIPQGKAPTFHLNLLKFGRSICTARSPVCSLCPLWDECTWNNKGYKPSEE